MRKYDTVEKFLSYATKPDRTNTNRKFLTRGTFNCLINDAEKVESRDGYALFGAVGTDNEAVKGSTDWETSGIGGDDPDLELHLRGTGTILQVYIGSVGAIDFNAWHTLKDSFSNIKFSFDTWWNNTEKIDTLVFVDGSSNQYSWSGALATLDTITATTLKLQGSLTWAQRRYLTSGTRQVRIRDSGGTWRTATYTGGESGDTLTLTTDLTAFTFTSGALIMQEVIVTASIPTSTYKADFIKTINNQLYVGSRTSRLLYVSKASSTTDFSFSSPRIVGEGALFTLDQAGRAIRILKENPTFFTSDFIYKAEFKEITVSSTLTEAVTCKRLKTAKGKGALSHDLTEETENGIAYISTNKELLLLEDASLTEVPRISNLSDLIKPDFAVRDFTDGHLFNDENRLYISAPADGLVYINEVADGINDDGQITQRRFWQPPQILPVQRFGKINGSIHGHSSIQSESYKLFYLLRDRVDESVEIDENNGQPIFTRLCLARYTTDERNSLKNTDEIITEGFITRNTTIDFFPSFELDKGETLPLIKEIDGSNTDITWSTEEDYSLGIWPLGDRSFGGGIEEEATEEFPKFRIIHEIDPQDFFDYTAVFETNGIDLKWQIVSHGLNTRLASSFPTNIKS